MYEYNMPLDTNCIIYVYTVRILCSLCTFVGVVGAEVAELFDAHVLELGHEVHGERALTHHAAHLVRTRTLHFARLHVSCEEDASSR